MKRWERLEDWLAATGTTSFTNWQLAHSAGITPAEASGWIQAYQLAQGSTASATGYVIRRTGRTSGATWHAGVSAADVREITKQFADDVHQRVDSVIVPIIEVIATKNPAARRQAISTGVQIGRLVEQLAHL